MNFPDLPDPSLSPGLTSPQGLFPSGDIPWKKALVIGVGCFVVDPKKGNEHIN
jgi:hypothetical protein